NGFQDGTVEDKGNFADEGQAKLEYHTMVEKVELPDLGAMAAGGADKGSTPPPSPTDEKNQDQLLGLAGGSQSGALGASMVQLYFPLIKPVLENAIRKATVE